MSRKPHVVPTKKFRLLVNTVYGGVNEAAERWGVEYLSLRRFLNETHGLNIRTAARIMEATCMRYEELFENKEPKVTR